MERLIRDVYEILLNTYGYQGWWPLISISDKNSDDELRRRGYHPRDYDLPKKDLQVYEICLGAILTQNTSWIQVEKALENLYKNNLIYPDRIMDISVDKLAELIKPSGYFNQKAKKIKIFTEFFVKLNGKTPSRDDLLNLWGIGKETADSILLYAYKNPLFVIDAYTKRIFSRLFGKDFKYYDIMRELFEQSFRKLPQNEKFKVFNEYHALIVEHGKNVCKRKPDCNKCVLKSLCLNFNI